MAFVAAYSKKTGKKLPYLVPEHHLDHPVLGRNLSRLPSAKKKASRKKAAEQADPVTTTEAPAAGDDKKE